MAPFPWNDMHDFDFVLVTDLDNTLVQHGDPQHRLLRKFNQTWRKELGLAAALVYSTGRSPSLFQELWVSCGP